MHQPGEKIEPVNGEWLDYLAVRRRALKMELKEVEAVLARHGRIKVPAGVKK
jgi:poly-D-alanine transfer protein DltD